MSSTASIESIFMQGCSIENPLAASLKVVSIGQSEIKEYLEIHGASTVKELSNSLNLNPRGVRRALRSMKKWDEVDKRKGEISYKADQWYLVEKTTEEENLESTEKQEAKA